MDAYSHIRRTRSLFRVFQSRVESVIDAIQPKRVIGHGVRAQHGLKRELNDQE
jgi:hypothetical protein